jgi:hypothetical protein
VLCRIGAGEEFMRREVPLVSKSGDIVCLTSQGKPVFAPDGKVAGFRGAAVLAWLR